MRLASCPAGLVPQSTTRPFETFLLERRLIHVENRIRSTWRKEADGFAHLSVFFKWQRSPRSKDMLILERRHRGGGRDQSHSTTLFHGHPFPRPPILMNASFSRNIVKRAGKSMRNNVAKDGAKIIGEANDLLDGLCTQVRQSKAINFCIRASLSALFSSVWAVRQVRLVGFVE